MQHFDNVYLTAQGYNILGQSNSGQICMVWSKAATYDIDATSWSQSAINGKTPADFPSTSQTSDGQITAATYQLVTVGGEERNTVQIEIKLNNGDLINGQRKYHGYAKTLCIFGKKQGDSSDSLIVIAFSANEQPVLVPDVNPFDATINCNIVLSQEVVNTITAPDSWYATARSFQDLYNRTVTTYADGNESAGEDQSIRGVKTFLNTTYHTGNVLPSANTYNLGSSTTNNKWNTVYATTFNGKLDGSLKTSRYIEGIAFDGSSNIANYGICNTDEGTTPKDVTIAGFSLVTGARVLVKFSKINTASNPNLRVNTSGTNGTAKPIKYRGTSAVSNASDYYRWQANDIVEFVYDGTNWVIVGWQTYAYYANSLTSTPSLTWSAATSSSAGSTLTVTAGGKTSSAITIDKVRQAYGLVDKPSLTWSSASSASAGSTLTVTAGGKTSDAVTIGTVRKAYGLVNKPSLAWTAATSTTDATLTVTAGGQTSSATAITKVLYAYNLGYGSSTSKVLSATSTSQLTSYGSIIPDGTRSLGSSSSHWNALYADYLYAGSTGQSIEKYIRDRLSAAEYKYRGQNNVQKYYSCVASPCGLFVATSVTIVYGYYGSNENWYSDNNYLSICRGTSTERSSSNSRYTVHYHGNGWLMARISSIIGSGLTTYSNDSGGHTMYMFLNDFSWSDSSGNPGSITDSSYTTRSKTFTGVFLGFYYYSSN